MSAIHDLIAALDVAVHWRPIWGIALAVVLVAVAYRLIVGLVAGLRGER